MSTYEPQPVTAAIAQQHPTHVRTTLPQLDQLAPALDLLDGLIAKVGAAREHQTPSWRTQFNTREQLDALVGKPKVPRLRVVAECRRRTDQGFAAAHDLPPNGPEAA